MAAPPPVTLLAPVRLNPLAASSAADTRQGWRDAVAAKISPGHVVGTWCATAAGGTERLVEMAGPELVAVTEGEVTITAPPGATGGASKTFKAGDVFVLPRGFTHSWLQGAGAVSKYYAESPVCAALSEAAAAVELPEAGVVECDTNAECVGDQQGWFHCDGPGEQTDKKC